VNRRFLQVMGLWVLALYLCTYSAWGEAAAEQIYRSTLPAVFTLEVETAKGKGQATGFAALREGVLVTAWHVVDGATKVTAKAASGESYKCAGLIDKDEIHDVALLRVKAHGLSRLSIEPSPPAVGSRVYVLGAPRGLDFSITDGLVSQIRTIEGSSVIQISCPIAPGSSGAPLLNERGEVVGVVVSGVSTTQGLNFAMLAKYVLGLDCERAPTEWASKRSGDDEAQAATHQSLEALMAQALVTVWDLDTAFRLIYAERDAETLNDLSPPPQYLTTLYRVLSVESASLSRQRGSFLASERARVKVFNLCRKTQLAFGKFIEFMETMSKKEELTGVREKEFLLSIETWFKTRIDAQTFDFMEHSSEFKRALPPYAQTLLFPKKPCPPIDLGLCVWLRTPTILVGLEKRKLGYRLGLRQFDEILAVNDKNISSIAELDDLLYANRGRNVKIAVKRDGRYTLINALMPRLR